MDKIKFLNPIIRFPQANSMINPTNEQEQDLQYYYWSSVSPKGDNNIMKYFGICDCGKWGEAPKNFRESKHFMVCDCGQTMYMHVNFAAHEYGYREENKITITKLTNHGEIN